MHVLSVDEQIALMSVLHCHRLGFAIMFDLATGLRIGESTTAILEGNVKTNSGFREIPLPDKIFERLL